MNVQLGSFKHKPWFIFLINVLGLLASAKKSDLLRFKIRHCEQINQILFELEKKVIFYIEFWCQLLLLLCCYIFLDRIFFDFLFLCIDF